jgi:hypothetical protein
LMPASFIVSRAGLMRDARARPGGVHDGADGPLDAELSPCAEPLGGVQEVPPGSDAALNAPALSGLGPPMPQLQADR